MFDINKVIDAMNGGIEASEQQAYHLERIADALTVVVLRMAAEAQHSAGDDPQVAADAIADCLDRLIESAQYGGTNE